MIYGILLVGNGWAVAEGDCGWTWESTRNGRIERRRIDLFLSKGKEWGEVRKEKFASDHWALLSDISWGEAKATTGRIAVDWDGLEKELEEVVEVGREKKVDEGVGGVNAIYKAKKPSPTIK